MCPINYVPTFLIKHAKLAVRDQSFVSTKLRPCQLVAWILSKHVGYTVWPPMFLNALVLVFRIPVIGPFLLQILFNQP